MSSRSLRRVLAGSLVTAFFSLSSPVSTEALDFLELPEAPSPWLHACQWLTAWISPVEEEPGTAASGTGASAEAPAESGRDAGWMLDPDG